MRLEQEYRWEIRHHVDGSANLRDRLRSGAWEPFAVTVKAGANVIWIRRRVKK